MSLIYLPKAAGAFLFGGMYLLLTTLSFADSLGNEICKQSNLRHSIEQKTKELGKKHRWEVVDFVVDTEVKKCIERILFSKFDIVRDSKNELIILGDNYTKTSDNFFSAPASDHGWATIYRSKTDDGKFKFIKLAFSVYPNGEINFLNLFVIEFFEKNEPVFYEVDENMKKIFSKHCIECHKNSQNNFLFKSSID